MIDERSITAPLQPTQRTRGRKSGTSTRLAPNPATYCPHGGTPLSLYSHVYLFQLLFLFVQDYQLLTRLKQDAYLTRSSRVSRVCAATQLFTAHLLHPRTHGILKLIYDTN